MEIILTGIFLVIITLMTLFFLLKTFKIAYKRREITLRKYTFLTMTTTVICMTIAVILPVVFDRIFNSIF